jgi:hypothetical protein
MVNQQHQSSRSLWVALLILIVAGAAYGFGFLLVAVKSPEMQAGLTNIATLGGVTAGLSLAGAAILSVTGRAVHDLVRKYGENSSVATL